MPAPTCIKKFVWLYSPQRFLNPGILPITALQARKHTMYNVGAKTMPMEAANQSMSGLEGGGDIVF